LLPAAAFVCSPAGQPALTCDIEVDNSLGTDVAEGAAVTLAALALFFHADRLSRSTAFRLSSGGLLGMTGMAVILLLIVIRCALRSGRDTLLLLLLLCLKPAV
jgi:hypothetical protein